MSSNQRPTVSLQHDSGYGTVRSYVTGFVSSIVLTIIAYLLVVNKVLQGRLIVAAIIAIALIQFLAQLIFFLHLGKESKPRWKLMVTLFMVLVVSILVIGSLWIMSNLNYRMTPQQMNDYMTSQDGGI